VVAALVAVTFLIVGMRLTRTGLTQADVAVVQRAIPRRLKVVGKVALSFVTQR
jgi:hypothetical protein